MGRQRRTARDERRRTHQQNFLTDAAVVRRLVADVRPNETVLDLGSGAGALTLAAAETGARVVAVEGDPVWADRLRQIAAARRLNDRVRVVECDLRRVVFPRGEWRVIANPPFGFTTALLCRLLDDPEAGPVTADLLMQWEVARKFSAQPPRTRRSAAWAPWWEFGLVTRVPRSSFRPQPKVDAGWLRIRRRSPAVLAPDLAPAWATFLEREWPPAPARRRPR